MCVYVCVSVFVLASLISVCLLGWLIIFVCLFVCLLACLCMCVCAERVWLTRLKQSIAHNTVWERERAKEARLYMRLQTNIQWNEDRFPRQFRYTHYTRSVANFQTNPTTTTVKDGNNRNSSSKKKVECIYERSDPLVLRIQPYSNTHTQTQRAKIKWCPNGIGECEIK